MDVLAQLDEPLDGEVNVLEKDERVFFVGIEQTSVLVDFVPFAFGIDALLGAGGSLRIDERRNDGDYSALGNGGRA